MFNTFYLYLALQDFLQGAYWSLYAMEQFKELTERKTLHIVEKHATAKVGFTFQNIQNGRTGEEHIPQYARWKVQIMTQYALSKVQI